MVRVRVRLRSANWTIYWILTLSLSRGGYESTLHQACQSCQQHIAIAVAITDFSVYIGLCEGCLINSNY